LLFWLSLIPFVTSWIGENHAASTPVAIYGIVLLMSGIAYFVLQKVIINYHEDDFTLKKAIGKNMKGKLSLVLYAIGVLLSFVNPWLAIGCYIFVAVMWVVP